MVRLYPRKRVSVFYEERSQFSREGLERGKLRETKVSERERERELNQKEITEGSVALESESVA